MRFYRLYFMDGAERVQRAELLECDGDEAARREALRLDHAETIEIWQADRLVGVVAPGGGRPLFRRGASPRG